MFKILSNFSELQQGYDHLFILAKARHFNPSDPWFQSLPKSWLSPFAEVLKKPKLKAQGLSLSSYTGHTNPTQITLVLLANSPSRFNSPSQREFVFQGIAALEAAESPAFICELDRAEDLLGTLGALARRQRLYKNSRPKPRPIAVLASAGPQILKPSAFELDILKGIAEAAKLVDTPPNQLDPEAFSAELKEWAKKEKGVQIEEISGTDLRDRGFGGIYNVGRAAASAPRLLILKGGQSSAAKRMALVGKGVCFDTGGLDLKVGLNMKGMKTDMGGAAACAMAFFAAHKHLKSTSLYALLPLVENAISPKAYRPDEIITHHSGLRVEVNNTDAEGRLILADALSYAARDLKAQVIIDAATLTGASLQSSGRYHAGLITPDPDFEQKLFQLGLETGDLVMPQVFAPEFLEEQFPSELADMMNSIKDRNYLGSASAAYFLYRHILGTEVTWAHLDIAWLASCSKNLGTGYGVSLLARAAADFDQE